MYLMALTVPRTTRTKVIIHNFQMGPLVYWQPELVLLSMDLRAHFFLLFFLGRVGPRATSICSFWVFIFFRVGGPVVNELRQFVALTQHIGVRQFDTLTTGNGARGAGGRARAVSRGALNYFFD